MPKLLFKFTLFFRDLDVPNNPENLLFHRWLPDGEKDAVTLNTGDSKSSLKVWFKRHGYVKDGKIEFDINRLEVDPEIMSLQGILLSGPIYGLLTIEKITKKQISILQKNKFGDAEYIKLAKRVIKTLQPPVSKFLNFLRIYSGQYWLREVEKWDSRKILIGAYCNSWKLKWSDNNGKTWLKFFPEGEVFASFSTIGFDFDDYISQNGWNELVKSFKAGYKLSLARITAIQANKYMDQGDLKHAFIEAVTALELAITEFLKEKLTSVNLKKRRDAYLNISLSQQVIGVVTGINEISQEKLEHTLKAIDIRHKIVHEGFNPTTKKKIHLVEHLKTVSLIIGIHRIRFPNVEEAFTGMTIMSPEKWKKYYKNTDKKS